MNDETSFLFVTLGEGVMQSPAIFNGVGVKNNEKGF
jgi:hypothetical protein